MDLAFEEDHSVTTLRSEGLGRWALRAVPVLACWAATAAPAQAGWQASYQLTCFCHKRQPAVAYYVAPAPVVAQYVAPAPATCCQTNYVQRTFYQPVTSYQQQCYYEPVTTYRTSYYYEPQTTCRYV